LFNSFSLAIPLHTPLPHLSNPYVFFSRYFPFLPFIPSSLISSLYSSHSLLFNFSPVSTPSDLSIQSFSLFTLPLLTFPVPTLSAIYQHLLFLISQRYFIYFSFSCFHLFLRELTTMLQGIDQWFATFLSSWHTRSHFVARSFFYGQRGGAGNFFLHLAFFLSRKNFATVGNHLFRR
jgi:hypothetical protein